MFNFVHTLSFHVNISGEMSTFSTGCIKAKYCLLGSLALALGHNLMTTSVDRTYKSVLMVNQTNSLNITPRQDFIYLINLI